MTTYKKHNDPITNQHIHVIKDGVLYIPLDEANTDYQEYLEWVADGGVAEPADTPEEAE